MNKQSISDRREVVKLLYGLGLSYQELANALGDSTSAIINDVRKLGGANAFPSRPSIQTLETRKAQFAAALRVYMELYPVRKKNPLAIHALRQYLGLREAEIFACGITTAMGLLLRAQHPPERRPYHTLLLALFGERREACDVDRPVFPNQPSLLDYLWAVFGEEVPWPTRDNFGSEIAKFLVAADREFIAPIYRGDEPEYAKVDEMIAELSPREQKVIRMRFGIGYGRHHTLKEVGVEFDVPRDRIRQIEAQAFREMRQSKRGQELRKRVMPDCLDSD